MVARVGLLVALLGVTLGFNRALAGGVTPAEVAEVAESMEFSGEMIARPVQSQAWDDRGLSADQAAARLAEAVRAVGAYTLVEYVPQTDEYVFEVPTGQTENDVIRKLSALGVFEYVEPNWIVYPIGCPNDPRLNQQWHHRANRLQSCDGWDLHTGNPNTSVGICDTGVRTTHEDLKLHRLEGYNAVNRRWESDGGEIQDINGHGTATTGCAAANGNNGKGVSGVGWNLSHRMIRVSNSQGGGSSIAILNHGARTAVERGDKVASVSYTGVTSSANRTSATYIKSIGGLLVWAAGNDGRRLTNGNRDADDLIVAGGTDQSDRKAGFSAYGPFVDLTAPAVRVVTTSNGGNSSYTSASGTSFACPLTAGLIALIWSANPSLTPDEVETILKEGCDDLGAEGVDDIFGYGRINIRGSLELAAGNEPAACCLSDGTCKKLNRTKCEKQGGRSRFGQTCKEVDCPQPGACCLGGKKCEITTEPDCDDRGGLFIGEGKSCKKACPCDLIKKLTKVKCSRGVVRALVKFKNKSRDGERITIQIGQRRVGVDIVGKKAKAWVCCFEGEQEVSLVDPAGCVNPKTADCG